MTKNIDNVNFFVNYYNADFGNEKYQEKRKYYSSNKSKDYINYIMSGIEEMKKLDYVAYMANREKSRGVFNQNGILSSEDRKNLREKLKNTKSVIWDCLITFSEDFGKKWCDNFEQAYNLMKNEFPKFLESCGLNPNNIEWFAGLHENTDNRHIHISFFENKPERIRPNKNEKQYSIGKLSKTAILNFKPKIELALTDFKAREILTRKKLQDYLNENLREKFNKILMEKLLMLAKKFPKSGALSYASFNMQFLKPEIDCITNYLIDKSESVKNARDEFLYLAKYKDEMLENYCKRNHYKNLHNFERQYMQDIYRRLGNMVINYAKEIKSIDIERLQLNAKYRKEKIQQKNKLLNEIKNCFYISDKFDFETIKAFQDYINKLDELKYQNLIEEKKNDTEL